ncbi:glycoside hydrolase family 47 protein [Serpula lacrymans var. lacrymans S7.9]|uniref:alpha-1,2-Mannosidase n=1 Tax=Serpula lacrymans var. lacrymans (strain S7.9) TaxID=578457 RepID=F8P466_SERL9|nr:glycoside hydrolase family 47 protein [Serpula lacrymans var. lacrymans S7.9]EGO22314.1 glycoside hydrolase family 47 protein [Serpula lacrymans var. lacrymans S7.9]
MLPTHRQSFRTHPSSDQSTLNKAKPHLPWPPTLWSTRAEEVRDAFLHAYSGYQEFAVPHDELLPVSGGNVDNFNGWSVSVVDSLDTMWIMGLQDEFYEAMPFLDTYVAFFETTIRYLGGLLSAYALSGEPLLLARADDLGKALLPALNTSSGLPMFAVNAATGGTKAGWNPNVLWAEAMSCQLEYKYLAHLTGRSQYYHKVEAIMDIMHNANIKDGLYPTLWNLKDGTPTNTQHSVGAFADSAYEYLLKQWLLTSRAETKAKEMYLNSAKGIIDNLLFLTPKRQLLYVTDTIGGKPSHIFEHLSCFLPGLLALGAHTLDLAPAEKQIHEWAASGLAYTCWTSYADQATGLGPDEMVMVAGATQNVTSGRWVDVVADWVDQGRPGGLPPGLHEPPVVKVGTTEERDYYAKKNSYLLRPETLESFYILWRTTGDERWRERGWSVFQAIQKFTRTKYGYASIRLVDNAFPTMLDEMPSYFLAETLKYLYLLFTDEELIPLDRWVFNTEAHPLPVFEWTNWEKAEYNILS